MLLRSISEALPTPTYLTARRHERQVRSSRPRLKTSSCARQFSRVTHPPVRNELLVQTDGEWAEAIFCWPGQAAWNSVPPSLNLTPVRNMVGSHARLFGQLGMWFEHETQICVTNADSYLVHVDLTDESPAGGCSEEVLRSLLGFRLVANCERGADIYTIRSVASRLSVVVVVSIHLRQFAPPTTTAALALCWQFYASSWPAPSAAMKLPRLTQGARRRTQCGMTAAAVATIKPHSHYM